MIEKGTPNITTAVWRAPSPPAFRSTAATIPNTIAQVILDIIGESPSISDPFFEDNIDATRAPESDDVTKKVTISINDVNESSIE